MDIIDLVIAEATLKSSDPTFTRADFLNEAAFDTRLSFLSPMETNIQLHFAGLDAPPVGKGLGQGH
jgi:hypothetical protein